MLERTEALVGHVERGLPRAPEARSLARLAAQLRSLRRLVVRRRVSEHAEESPAWIPRDAGVMTESATVAIPKEQSNWEVARPSAAPGWIPSAHIGPDELQQTAAVGMPASRSAADETPALHLGAGGTPPRSASRLISVSPRAAGQMRASRTARGEAPRSGGVVSSEVSAPQALPQAAALTELFRLQRAAARTRGVAPEVSAQRSGATNGNGGGAALAPPTQRRRAAVQVRDVPALLPRAPSVQRHGAAGPRTPGANERALGGTSTPREPDRAMPEPWSTLRDEQTAHASPATSSGLTEARRLSRLADDMEAILRADARRHGIVV
jgi:hypothetical protein